jgi:hypothetical protein
VYHPLLRSCSEGSKIYLVWPPPFSYLHD